VPQENSLFDIHFFTFPIATAEKSLYPGFLVMLPPKKPARGRESDILLLYFKLYGNSSITDAGLKTWLENKASIYHRSSGTVTSGIRAIFDDINEDLLERNSRFAKQNGQVSGNLQVMVLKKEIVYLAVCGTGSGFLVSDSGVEQAADENNNRGLGLSQSNEIRFVQKTLGNGDFLLFANEIPANWTNEVFTDAHGLSNEALYRRLFAPGIGEAQGVLIRFREGSGKIILLKPRMGESAIETPTSGQSKPAVQEPSVAAVVAPFVPDASASSTSVRQPTSAVAGPTDYEGKPQIRLTPQSGRHSAHTQEPQIHPVSQQVREPAPINPGVNRTPERERRVPANLPLPSSDDVKVAVGGALRKGAEVRQKTESWTKKALQKVLPGPSDQPLKFSKGLLVFIAIAVPVIIVAIAASLYVRNGRNGLFEGYLAQAQQLSMQADSQTTDAALRLSDLQQSLYWLDKADQFGKSDQSTQLRNHVQTELDEIEGVTRINMVQAVNSSLPSGSVISQLVVSNADLYALDGTTGRVFRFTQSGAEYVQDSTFDCGPNENSQVAAIGKLVDMVPISIDNTYGAAIMAIDAQGRLDYCVPGESGYIVSLEPPDMGWVAISSITLNQGNLYVLDVRGNAIYRYEGSANQFTDKPTLFFDETIPSLTQAIDIEVVGYELYILRSNGELVECTYSPLKDMKSTECTDPASYNDSRTGKVVKTNTFSNASFTQMHMTQAPDSSLYFLDTTGKSIYHLSYARNLQRILYPRLTDGENIDQYSPTAFFISPTRQVFMAFGGLIYYGQMP
jgi:hypothetical protein